MLKKINKKRRRCKMQRLRKNLTIFKYELLLNESSLSSTSLNCSIVSKSCTCQN